jgi:hypothetical protein
VSSAEGTARMVRAPDRVPALGVYTVLALGGALRLLTPSQLVKSVLDGTLLLLLCVWPLTWRDDHGDRRTLKLLSFFNALFFAAVGLMLIAFEVWPDALRPETTALLYRNVGGEPLAVLDNGLLLMVIVQIIFLAVWTLPRKRETSWSAWQPLGQFLDRPMVIATTALAYTASEISSSSIPGGLLNVVVIWGVLLNVAIAVRFTRWLRGQGDIKPWLALVIIKAGVGLFTGWRGRLLELAALLLIVFLAERGRLPIRWLVATGLVFMFLLLPFLIGYRSVLWGSDPTGVGSRVDAASAALEGDAGQSWSDRFLTSYRFLAVRLGGQRIDELSGIAAQDVRLNGGSLWPFLTAPIPRAIWPTKPALSPELNKIAVVLKKSPSAGQADLTTSMVWTQYTDMYLNFGLAGIVGGSILLGLYCRWLGRQLLRTSIRTPETVGMFVVMFGPFWGEYTLGYVFQTEIQLFMLFGVVYWVLRVGTTAAPEGVFRAPARHA